MTIAQNMLLLYVPVLVFVLCSLALVIISLFKLEKYSSLNTILKV